jgi:hypothetical protein
MRGAFTLTPAESKRLLAKAVVSMKEVRNAMERAYVVISPGTTNAFVAQELFGLKDLRPERFAIGINSHGLLCITDPATREPIPLVAFKGQLVKKSTREAVDDFHVETVIIKGGNAVDHDGNVGIILGGFTGGGLGETVGTVVSQGLHYIVPVSVEKMVASVPRAAEWTGAKLFDITMGADFGLMQLPNTIVVTEIEALKLLTGVNARHVASGGIGSSVGSCVFVIEGDRESVLKTIELIESIKGEPPLPDVKGICETCRYSCKYKGLTPDQLPAWLAD